MKSINILLFFLITTLGVMAQTPQNVTQHDNGNSQSLWTSSKALIFVAVLIVLLVVSRKWSKKIHEKRDELTQDDD